MDDDYEGPDHFEVTCRSCDSLIGYIEAGDPWPNIGDGYCGAGGMVCRRDFPDAGRVVVGGGYVNTPDIQGPIVPFEEGGIPF